jgi:thymidylate synthase (FAD)
LNLIEQAGRTCYKSDSAYSAETNLEFAAMILKRGHESVIEHASATAKFICNRGVTHELVRHRLASYSQESTRYCNYSLSKFGKEITVIRPPFASSSIAFSAWYDAMLSCEVNYFKLLEAGCKPQIARGVLPIDLKTEIVATMNLRQWRHFFKLRAAKPAHPQMRELASELLIQMRNAVPVIFYDVGSTEWARHGLE